MSWVWRARPPTHECAQPHPSGSIDDLWRCDECGTLWRIGKRCDMCEAYGYHYVGQCAVGWAWRPARFWQKVRFRRVSGEGEAA